MSDFNKDEFRDYLETKVASATAKTYASDMLVCVNAFEEMDVYKGKELTKILEDFLENKKINRNYLYDEFLDALVKVGSSDTGLYGSLPSKSKHYLKMLASNAGIEEKQKINAGALQTLMPIADIINELKSVYAGHEDLEEMITDLEDDGYHDYWAEKLCTEDFNKNLKLAKSLYEIAVEKAEDSSDLKKLAKCIKDPDGFNNEDWGNKLLKVALDNAEDYMDFAGFANDYAAEEESKARELYQKAVDTANDPLEYQNIAMLVEEYLGDSKWAEEIKEIAPLNTIFIRANGECSEEDEEFLQLAISAKSISSGDNLFHYMYVLGQPFTEGGWFFKTDVVSGQVWKGVDSSEWTVVVNAAGDILEESISTEEEDTSVLDTLAENIYEYVIHASELNEDDTDDIWYLKEGAASNMEEECEDDEKGFELCMFYIKEGDIDMIQNAIEPVENSGYWPFHLGTEII